MGTELCEVVDRVPGEVQRDRRRSPGQLVHERRVVYSLEHVSGPVLLGEHGKPGARVAVPPRRSLDLQRCQPLLDCGRVDNAHLTLPCP